MAIVIAMIVLLCIVLMMWLLLSGCHVQHQVGTRTVGTITPEPGEGILFAMGQLILIVCSPRRCRWRRKCSP